jgi:HEPN domain-containing protein
MARRDSRELARILLDKAAKDEAAVRILGAEQEIADEVVGLHAQQAAEKSLKAALAWHGIDYRLTHDIAYLTELLETAGVAVPSEVAAADALTPWAAALRYEEPPTAEGLDRDLAASSAAAALAWASRLIEPPKS